jgi:hypothetical protein
MSKRNRVARPKEELKRELVEQLQLLQHSCNLYDQGVEPAAKHIALIIRILVHEHGQSKALLEQLGLRQVRFSDSTEPIPSRNLIPDHKLVAIRMGNGNPRYVPVGEYPERMRRVRFQDWWNETIFRVPGGHQFSRRDLVLHVADTDGGAHVDPNLDEAYMELSRRNSLGWTTAEAKPLEGRPELAAVRQMGSELLSTIRNNHPEYLEQTGLVRDSPSTGQASELDGRLSGAKARSIESE